MRVVWEMAEDADFRRRVAGGVVTTDPSVDFTVKLDVEGLSPDGRYFYRFHTLDGPSDVGRARTLPRGEVTRWKLGVVCCANFSQGYYHVYREVAQRDDLDVVVHLGDYIYEDAGQTVRTVEPPHELLTLEDYRGRYAHYRLDPDLQAAHQAHSFVLVWDDHEVVDNAYREGGARHDSSDGEYVTRRAAALQAYFEWLPVREPEPGNRERVYRRFEVGDLLTLHMLDTRHIAREQALDLSDFVDPVSGALDAVAFEQALAAPRDLLGAEQRDWLEAGWMDSDTRWHLIGQQVLMLPLRLPAPVATGQVSFADYGQILVLAQTDPALLTPDQLAVLGAPQVPFNLDAWDGYPTEREWLLRRAQELDRELVLLSGDSHNAWAADLTYETEPVGVELAVSSVSSRGLETRVSGIEPDAFAALAVGSVPGLRYAETAHRGYLVVEVDAERLVGTWHFVDTVRETEYQELVEREQGFEVRAGERRLRPVT